MISILVPLLERAHRVLPVLASIDEATPEPHEVVFICSPGDHAVIAAAKATPARTLILGERHGPGDYARKINFAYRMTVAPLLFLAADDLHFHPGWYEAATARLDDAVQVVGTNDMCNPRVLRGEHSTHSLVTRDYVDRFGTIDRPGQVLHEAYPHEFVDDEFIGTAKHRGAFAFAFDSYVEHLHPMVGKAPTDGLYDQQRLRMRRGRPIFEQRRHLWT